MKIKIAALMVLSCSGSLMQVAMAAPVVDAPVAAKTLLTLPTKPVLTLQAARIVADAAEADAVKRGMPGGIVVVDDGGNPILVERMDGAAISSTKLAFGKAKTAAQFRAPSKRFEDALNGGRAALTTSGLTMMSGGAPITVDGKVVGAIGVSTLSPPADDPIAEAASKALDALTQR